jgi:hypothetical protein
MASETLEIEWTGDDESLNYREVLYLYLAKRPQKILYIGKADRCSVRERLRGAHKAGIFDHIANEMKIKRIEILVGQLCLQVGNRFSRQLLGDVESLLIYRLKPPANSQNIFSRSITRSGLSIECTGSWPIKRSRFIDRQ